jgi:iron complex outermembrane receptor protein
VQQGTVRRHARRGKPSVPTRGLAVAAILLTAFPSFAADEPDPFELSPEQLFGATVTSASRSAGKLWDAPAAIYVLSNEDIRRSGATSIPEALRMVPGVQVARTGSGNWAVTVRGFNSGLANKLLVLMDGREVYDGLFSGVYWDVQDTTLEDIDRIEVIRGPGASLWGANAVNGVINIITKTAAETQGNLASVTAGNRENIVDARHGGTFGENGHYRVYGKYTQRDSNQNPTGLDALDDQLAQRGGFRADWSSPEKGSYTLQGDMYDNHDGQRRDIPSYIAPFVALDQEENIDARGGNILGRWNRTLNDGSHLTLQGYVDYTAREQAYVDDTRTSIDLDSEWELPQQDHHKVILGARYRLSHDTLDETRPANGFPVITFDDATRNDQLFSAFVQDKITLDPDRWFLTLGSKIEHNDYTGFEIQPNARLQFHPDSKQMFWGAISRAVRTTSRLESDIQATQTIGTTGAPPVIVSIDTLPNPDLNSEEMVAYELGYRRQLTPKASLDLTAFYNDYDSIIAYSFGSIAAGTDPTRIVFGLLPRNNMTAEIYGTEAVLDWQLLPTLNLSGSYSLLKANFHEPANSFSTSTEGSAPQQQFNLRAQWDVRDNVTFDTMLYYVDSLPDFGLGDYWRLDTRLGWQMTDQLAFNLVGQNLLDAHHQEFNNPTDAYATEIPRAFYGQFVWKF